MKKQLLLFILMLLPLLANAEAVEIDGIYYNLITKGKVAEVTFKTPVYYNDYSGEVIIPEKVTYEGVEYLVKFIGKNAFLFCKDLTSVIIPSTVTTIGESSFQECEALSSITIPNSVTTIGNRAFRDCTNLESVTLSNSITSIGEYAFYGCKSITAINLPDNMTSIGTGAFSFCTNLTSINIPNGIINIEDYLFNNCENLTNVSIPNSVTTIGYMAFNYCINLTSITIPNSVTSIGNQSFNGCSSLTSIIIPNSVKDIDYYAFQYCSSLTSITLGSGVKTIKTQAFANCPEITDVYCFATNVPVTNTTAFDGSYPEYVTLHVPEGSLESYKISEPWSNFGTFSGMKICAKPTINFANGKMFFACETEGVGFVPTITCTPKLSLNGNELEFGGTYTISVYAVRDGYYNSEEATITIEASKMGDLNGDGEVSIADITLLVNKILGK